MKGETTIMSIEQGKLLTTIDNPFNPHTHWEAWLRWDSDMEYHTPQYLARISNVQVGDSEVTMDEKISAAKEEILDNDVLGIYTLI